MTIILSWLRLELRRRWRSLAVLALLIAISGATVMAAIAGARRGASAQERLDRVTLPATAMILANTPGFDWAPIRRLPEVEVLSNFVVDYNISTIGKVPPESIGFPITDQQFLHTIEKAHLFAGEAPDTTSVDEVAVTRKFVETYHKGIGDTVTIILAKPKEILAQHGFGPGGRYTGPRVVLHIVGVGEGSARWGIDEPGSPGGLLVPAGLYAKYKQNIVGPPLKSVNYINALVRLRGGEAALPQLSRDITRITGRSDIEISNLVAGERDAQHHIAFESRCLVAFGVAALIAALFLVGQAIARYAAANTEELRTLRALGMTPRSAIATATAGPAIAGVLGAALAVAGAVVASRWLPYGTAGLIEPSPGTSWDWVVFGPGLAFVVMMVAGGAAAAAWFTLRAARREGATRRSSVAVAVGRSAMPVPVALGTRFALEAGRGRTSVPVRPALVGAVMGVLGVVGAFTFSEGVSDAASHPERFGQTYQIGTFAGLNGKDFGPVDVALTTLRKDPLVAGVDDARTAVATASGSDDTVSLWAYSTDPKPIPMVVLSGRAPESADEVVLGPKTLTALHAAVGEHITLTGSRKAPVTFHIVGSGLIPVGPHNGYADGGWVTEHGYDTLFSGFKFHLVLVTLAPGVQTGDAIRVIDARLGNADKRLKQMGLRRPDPISEVAVLQEVRKLPVYLAIFLALLAVGAVGHALATAVRRRSHDLAVLRAVGMTQWQCRWVVVTQASVLAIVGLLFGIPLGLAIGRSLWRVVADYTPIDYVSPTALWALALIGPAALVLSNLLAAWPGQRAARLRVAHILRAE
ncbi:MAG TPA: FtsX-like permease family protein [Jatrophihabitans sp.]|jgi:ABC-type lipoprotein release transport system permease subunit|nr:FtsX-like permease family protein [Jatrophihabitans sp.]